MTAKTVYSGENTENIRDITHTFHFLQVLTIKSPEATGGIMCCLLPLMWHI